MLDFMLSKFRRRAAIAEGHAFLREPSRFQAEILQSFH